MKIVWNVKGFETLKRDPGVQRDIVRRANAIAKQAGDGYIVLEPTQRPKRDRAAILTGTRAARRDNARNMTLVKALGAGR